MKNSQVGFVEALTDLPPQFDPDKFELLLNQEFGANQVDSVMMTKTRCEVTIILPRTKTVIAQLLTIAQRATK